MKRIFFLLITLFGLVMFSCTTPTPEHEKPDSKPTKYYVSFNSDQGTNVETQEVEEGRLATKPANPIKENHSFMYWMLNNVEYDFSKPVTSNITLVAKWQSLEGHTHEYTSKVFESTCEENGYTLYTCICGDSYQENIQNALDHNEVYHEKKEPTCTEAGYEQYITCTRCNYTTYQEIEELGHDEVEHAAQVPTNSAIGWDKYVTCTRCDYTTYQELPALGVNDLEIYVKNGRQYVNFGRYPKTHVGDKLLISELNKLNETNDQGYYEYDGNEYLKVVANPWITGLYIDSFNQTRNYEYSDGSLLKKNQIEWFKVEPIQWIIIYNFMDGNYLLLSEYILDASVYYKDQINRVINGVEIFPTNYKYSDIRSYLNNIFLYNAFNENEKCMIQTSEISNGSETYYYSGVEKFSCPNTFDKIFLLSYRDLKNNIYGFNGASDMKDSLRSAIVSDYVKAKGVIFSSNKERFNLGYWYTRSPFNERVVSFVGDSGTLGSLIPDSGHAGIRPSCIINIE